MIYGWNGLTEVIPEGETNEYEKDSQLNHLGERVALHTGINIRNRQRILVVKRFSNSMAGVGVWSEHDSEPGKGGKE